MTIHTRLDDNSTLFMSVASPPHKDDHLYHRLNLHTMGTTMKHHEKRKSMPTRHLLDLRDRHPDPSLSTSYLIINLILSTTLTIPLRQVPPVSLHNPNVVDRQSRTRTIRSTVFDHLNRNTRSWRALRNTKQDPQPRYTNQNPRHGKGIYCALFADLEICKTKRAFLKSWLHVIDADDQAIRAV